MGLDAVELVMAVEDKFSISIRMKKRTVGDLKRLVRAKLDVVDVAGCLTQRAFHLIRKNATAEFGVLRHNCDPIPRLRVSYHNLLAAKAGSTSRPHSASHSCPNY
jgi:hypothetical protein